MFVMELTENERLMLAKKKEAIQKLTAEILDIANDPKQTREIKKKITDVLSILSTIGSYANSKEDLNLYLLMAELIFTNMGLAGSDVNSWKEMEIPQEIEEFCIYVNMVQFDFNKKGLKIIIPKIEIPIFKVK